MTTPFACWTYSHIELMKSQQLHGINNFYTMQQYKLNTPPIQVISCTYIYSGIWCYCQHLEFSVSQTFLLGGTLTRYKSSTWKNLNICSKCMARFMLQLTKGINQWQTDWVHVLYNIILTFWLLWHWFSNLKCFRRFPQPSSKSLTAHSLRITESR